MSSIVSKLYKLDLIDPPTFLTKNSIQSEVIMGSIAYGCNEDISDMDIYGFCIPPEDIIYPEKYGFIKGFGNQGNIFNQYQQHHVYNPNNKTEYDITIYNIVKYFQLCMENNPNIIDSLFVPDRCVILSTPISDRIRNNRELFLSKASWHKFKGYAYSQLNKCSNKAIHSFVNRCKEIGLDPTIITKDNLTELSQDIILHNLFKKVNQSGNISRRIGDISKYGYDIKFAYHIVRLLDEVEQILTKGALDLEQNREQLKSIRRGDWTFEEIQDYFKLKEKQLEDVYLNSKLRYHCDETKIKNLLIESLHEFYGVKQVSKYINESKLLEDLKQLIKRYR